MGTEAVDRHNRDLPAGRRADRAQIQEQPFPLFGRPRVDRREQPVDDQGLFGPASVSWRIHANPMIVVGGFRALMIQALHPLAMAGIAQHSDYREDPLGRLRRTARYMHTVIFSDAATAHAAGEHVRVAHAAMRAYDPITDREFDAGDPETMLWIHCVQTHSFLAAHRAFVEPLSNEEQNRYLTEQVTAAELVGIPPAGVPDSLDSYRGYFAAMLPKLCNSSEAAATIRFVSRPNPLLVPAAEWPFAINLVLAARAAVTLVPRSLRQMANLPAPGLGQYAIHKLAQGHGRLLRRAMGIEALANSVDGFTQRKLGTTPLPAGARR